MSEAKSDSYRPRKRSRGAHSDWGGSCHGSSVQPKDESSGAELDDKDEAVRMLRGGSLDVFLSMPLDVVFEVLGFLHPSDLLALTCTNKTFRRTIYSQGSVWKRSRTANGIPDCYPGVSETRWAFLLFGGNYCHSCGARNVRRVDFGLCLRVCAKCNKKNIIRAKEFEKMFPQVDVLVLSLVRQANTGPSPCFDLAFPTQACSTSRKTSKGSFSIADMRCVVEEWHMHQENIQLGTDNAEEEFTLYLGQRMREVDRITEVHAGVCIEWAISCVNERNRELGRIRRKRCKAIREGFITLGFERQDFYSVMRLSIVRAPTPLTSTAWAEIQSQLVPLIKARRDARITRQTAYIWSTQVPRADADILQIIPWAGADIRQTRTMILRESYSAYLFQLLPLAFWAPAHLPTVGDLLMLAPFKSIVESDPSIVVDSSSFAAAIQDLQLPQMIVEWQNSLSVNHV